MLRPRGEKERDSPKEQTEVLWLEHSTRDERSHTQELGSIIALSGTDACS